MSIETSFELTGQGLRKLFGIWNVPIPKDELILFAFRGCLPEKSSVEKSKGWTRSLQFKPIALDYTHMRCTIGIWNQKTDQLFAAAGSSVPHRDNVLKASARKGLMRGRGTNQMEPGFYSDLRKGEHLQGKLMGHAALRQTGYRFYRRSHHKPPYTKNDPLYFGNPYDNLHGAWNIDEHEPGFRSAGCMVVAGIPYSPRLPESKPNQGAWKIFHDLIYATPQKNFSLLLLPAIEVQAALKKKKRSSLCYGSQGEAVKFLQEKLKKKKRYSGRSNGKLGVATYRAWNASGFIDPA